MNHTDILNKYTNIIWSEWSIEQLKNVCNSPQWSVSEFVDHFEKCLDVLNNQSKDSIQIKLIHDFAKYSFGIVWRRKEKIINSKNEEDIEWRFLQYGALICHSSGEDPLSVYVGDKPVHWTINT